MLNIFLNSLILFTFWWKNVEFASKLRFNAYQYIGNCAYYIFQSHMIKLWSFTMNKKSLKKNIDILILYYFLSRELKIRW